MRVGIHNLQFSSRNYNTQIKKGILMPKRKGYGKGGKKK